MLWLILNKPLLLEMLLKQMLNQEDDIPLSIYDRPMLYSGLPPHHHCRPHPLLSQPIVQTGAIATKLMYTPLRLAHICCLCCSHPPPPSTSSLAPVISLRRGFCPLAAIVTTPPPACLDTVRGGFISQQTSTQHPH